MFDELRALSYLASRPEVDPARGSVWHVYGATKPGMAPRSARPGRHGCCCLTNYQSLIDAGGLSKQVSTMSFRVVEVLRHIQSTN